QCRQRDVEKVHDACLATLRRSVTYLRFSEASRNPKTVGMDSPSYVALQTVMMPRDANPQGSIFGGVILGLIDMAAYVGAKRLVVQAGGPLPMLVTVAINRVELHQPVY